MTYVQSDCGLFIKLQTALDIKLIAACHRIMKVCKSSTKALLRCYKAVTYSENCIYYFLFFAVEESCLEYGAPMHQ